MLPNNLQLDGTRRTFGIETAIYEAIERQAFMAIDEIESSLHPDLVEFILEKFLREKNESQLLITSHYDPLLNTVDDLLRKDSIWFTEKTNQVPHPYTLLLSSEVSVKSNPSKSHIATDSLEPSLQ